MAINIDELRVIATPEGILKRIEQVRRHDLFGEYCPRLIDYLPYEYAKPFLKDGADEDEWNPSDDEELRSELHRYMNDWWKQKVEDGRGLSCHRGRAQVVNLMFLAGIEAWVHIGIDDNEGMNGGWYQQDAYNTAADVFGLPHIKGPEEDDDD